MARLLLCAMLIGFIAGCDEPDSSTQTEPSGPRVQLVIFTAAWCGPCKTNAPEIDAIMQDAGNRVERVTVDIDNRPDLKDRFGVRAVPTYVILVDGVEHSRTSEPRTVRHNLGL